MGEYSPSSVPIVVVYLRGPVWILLCFLLDMMLCDWFLGSTIFPFTVMLMTSRFISLLNWMSLSNCSLCLTVKDVKDWLKQNFLTLNENKTEMIVFGNCCLHHLYWTGLLQFLIPWSWILISSSLAVSLLTGNRKHYQITPEFTLAACLFHIDFKILLLRPSTSGGAKDLLYL